MGNDIRQLGSSINQRLTELDNPNIVNEKGIPLSLHQNVEDARNVNILLRKNIVNFGVKLELDPNSISRNSLRWENNLIRGTLALGEVLELSKGTPTGLQNGNSASEKPEPTSKQEVHQQFEGKKE